MGERSTLNIPGQVGVYSQGAESGLVDGKYYFLEFPTIFKSTTRKNDYLKVNGL